MATHDHPAMRRCDRALALVLFVGACIVSGGAAAKEPAAFAERKEDRARMVEHQIEARDVRNPRVLAAMRRVPRHRFMPEDVRPHAYEDRALPIGHGQTISQPFIVASMSEQLDLQPDERVLEVGTGSGYQAAVLAELVSEVYTIEIVAPLAERADATLDELGYEKVHVRHGDGYRGWPEAAPFDAIIVTAAPDHVPQPLVDQLAVGGRLVIPVGSRGYQDLRVITREKDGVSEEILYGVMFVPMTGEAQK
jgi:protein-L-isoaspartate(D-aspartate) O-methyltransferase